MKPIRDVDLLCMTSVDFGFPSISFV